MITVVIPIYNREHTILRAIQSIKDQTIPVDEIILIDDASTDNAIQCVQSKYPDVHIIALPYKQGAQAARARGVFEAKGEWIAFLDSDDYWLPQKLELQLEKASQGYDVVHGACLRILEDGSKELFAIPPDEGDVFKSLLQRPGPLYPCLLAKKVCFEVCGYPDFSVAAYQEWDLALTLAQHYSFGFVPDPLFCYEVQKDSISVDNLRGILGYWQIVTKWEKVIVNLCDNVTLDNHYKNLANLARNDFGLAGYAFFRVLFFKKNGAKFFFIATLTDMLRLAVQKLVVFLKKFLFKYIFKKN